MSAPLEPVVRHEVRLDILCCLVDRGPLEIVQVSARTGRDERLVGHHMKLLKAFGLVRNEGGKGGRPARYVACLDDHPDWVAGAVRDHRQTERWRSR